MPTRIISIDIGYSNMAIVDISTDFDELFKVDDVHKVNLNKFNESQVHQAMIKFIEEFRYHFDKADIIIIERQPPLGLTNIQDILAFQYSNKVKLICPRSMHKHFGVSKLDYEHRKNKTEEISKEYLENFKKYTTLIRKHDVADALCLALYYFQINKINKYTPIDIPDDINQFFESLKFVPRHSRTF
jgi:hypothetical protein